MHDRLSLDELFPAVSRAEWESLAERELGAPPGERLRFRTDEGLELLPLHTRADRPADDDPSGFPGLPPFTRGTTPHPALAAGPEVRAEHAHPDLDETRRAVRRDLEGGAAAVRFVLDAPARAGVTIRTATDLETALEGSAPPAAVALDGGSAFLPAAALLAAMWTRCAASSGDCRGSFEADPLGALAREGSLPVALPRALEELGDLAAWTGEALPGVRAVRVGASVYHDAGAGAELDLALAMATGLEYLRAMTAAGLDVDRAARQIAFEFSVGSRFFLATAKLRAARRLWSRIVEVAGGGPDAGALRMTVRPARREITARDPWVNMLRNTAGCVAATLAGAEAVIPVPFDTALGEPGRLARRVARSTPLILREEGQLHRVADPAGGSWLIESLTDALAGRAWELFREIERASGMSRALLSGWVAERVGATAAARERDVARRCRPILGVSEFPALDETLPESRRADLDRARREAGRRLEARGDAAARDAALAGLARAGAGSRTAAAVAAAVAGASLAELAAALGHGAPPLRIEPFRCRPVAAPFEELRDASDAHLARHGRRPRVFLAGVGPPAEHSARAAFARQLYRAGGFETVAGSALESADDAVAAFRDSGARVAVLCSSDARYATAVPELAPRLREAGARTVIVAGRPGDHEAAWRAAGVDRFVYAGCDALAELRELARAEGVR